MRFADEHADEAAGDGRVCQCRQTVVSVLGGGLDLVSRTTRLNRETKETARTTPLTVVQLDRVICLFSSFVVDVVVVVISRIGCKRHVAVERVFW